VRREESEASENIGENYDRILKGEKITNGEN